MMDSTVSSLRFFNLLKSFKLAIHPILTSCSREDIQKAFPHLERCEHQVLHKLLMQVISSLHESMEEEFESICQETQVIPALELVEQLVEEQKLDILHTEKSNLVETRKELTKAKLDKIQCLETTLDKLKEANEMARARLEFLKKGIDDVSTAETAVEKLKNFNLQYGQMKQKAFCEHGPDAPGSSIVQLS